MKKKDTFYFPHDSNAKDDIKMTLLQSELGMEGYGIYWMLLESLRDQSDYKLPLESTRLLARKYFTKQELILRVINDFDLFTVNKNHFFSKSFNRRMKKINERREKLSAAGKKGNAVKWKHLSDYKDETNVIAMRSQPDRNLIATRSQPDRSKEKERKEKESKRNIFQKPSRDEVAAYCQERNNRINPDAFLDYYDMRGWTVGKNNTPMKDWRAAVRTWEKNPVASNNNLGIGESINEQGERTYGRGVIVPIDAPPRPSSNHFWHKAEKEWRIS